MFGDIVLELLEEKNLSQKQFAAMLEIPYTTLNGYINNKREPDFKTLLDISKALQVPVDYLLENNPSNESFLTNRECSFVKLFRKLNNEQKELLEIQAATMIRQNARIQNTNNNTSPTQENTHHKNN